MSLSERAQQFAASSYDELISLTGRLCAIPAPSHHEELRAEFCLKWLHEHGCEGAYIDEAKNVIWPYQCDGKAKITCLAAHTDTVFPDTEPFKMEIRDGRAYCPAVGDDTMSVAQLMLIMACIAGHKPECPTGLLFALNACEEGLGNLRGTRHLMEQYSSRVTEFITFDGCADQIVDQAVGSHRFRVEIHTEGGHSYKAFGNRNAIAAMAELISQLYAIEVPPEGKTTYNVGTICGGTSVNTIAQRSEMLYEFRSDCRDSLAAMERQFEAVIDDFRVRGFDVRVNVVGVRPCSGDVDESRHQALKERAAEAVRRHYGFAPYFASGSTDCNIPLSLGIPAICPGCVVGGGAHTREEYVEIGSLRPGLGVAFDLILHHF